METAILTSKELSVENVKTISISKESSVINVSADKLWEIMGPGFANVGKWSRAVDHATVSGESQFEGAICSNRACDLNASGFNKISETIIEYNEDDKVLAYSIDEGMPGFVKYAANRWNVVDLGPNKSKVQMNVTLRLSPVMGTLVGWMLKMNMNSVLVGVIEDMKIFAETGKPSKTKLDRMKKLGQI